MHLLSCGVFFLADTSPYDRADQPYLQCRREVIVRQTVGCFLLCWHLKCSYSYVCSSSGPSKAFSYTLWNFVHCVLSYSVTHEFIPMLAGCIAVSLILHYNTCLCGVTLCVMCWDSLVGVTYDWYYHMLMKFLTCIHLDLPGCQCVCCTEPPKIFSLLWNKTCCLLKEYL